MVRHDEATVHVAPAPVAAQPHPARCKAMLGLAKPPQPRTAGGRGRRQDQLASKSRARGRWRPFRVDDQARIGHCHARAAIDVHARGDRAMQQ
ncbi:hypothetical protein CNMCM8686_008412 [Aspergillus fumigatus]|nr:hypothetical protein CNMCM8686_008412 [Aspergillus fumigatus]